MWLANAFDEIDASLKPLERDIERRKHAAIDSDEDALIAGTPEHDAVIRQDDAAAEVLEKAAAPFISLEASESECSEASEEARPPVRLANLGNTCFAAAAVQSLWCIGPFSAYYSQRWTSWPAFVAWVRLLDGGSFDNAAVEYDAAEFFEAAVNNTHMKEHFFEANALHIGGVFGELFTCLTCGEASTLDRHDSFVTLVIQARRAPVAALLDESYGQREVEKICNFCAVNRMHTGKMYVEIWGTHLFVQVKRFNNRGGKEKAVGEIAPVIQFDGEQWKLVAIIRHIGATIRRGHYIAYVARGDPTTWYMCSDTDVSSAPWATVRAVEASAYLFEHV